MLNTIFPDTATTLVTLACIFSGAAAGIASANPSVRENAGGVVHFAGQRTRAALKVKKGRGVVIPPEVLMPEDWDRSISFWPPLSPGMYVWFHKKILTVGPNKSTGHP